MSGIAGAYSLAEKPVDLAALESLSRGVSYRGPDAAGRWSGARLGLLHYAFWTTPQEGGERQPLTDGLLALTSDVRLDNRQELIEALRAEGEAPDERSGDARLILDAYRQWGEACVPRLIGDFAFALWDRGREKLLLARDACGMRPLYYALVEDTFYFASTIRALAGVFPRRPDLNHRAIWRFLNNDFEPWLSETVFDPIRRLPPAHLLTVGPEGLNRRLYFRFGDEPPALKNAEEWIDGFQKVLDQALLARLRTRTPVAMMVSGGLDSSSLACSAQTLLRSVGAPAIQLHTATYQRTPGADEQRYFEAVAKACPDFPVVTVPSDDFWGLQESGTDQAFPLDEPELSLLRSHSRGLLRSASTRGCRVVITGEGANQLLCHGVYSAAPLIGATRWNDLAGEIIHFRRRSGADWHKLLFYFAQPRLPRFVSRALLRRFGGRPVVMPWLRGPSPQLGASTSAPPAAGYWKPRRSSVLGAHAHRLFRGAFDAARYTALDLLSADAGVEWRAPFLDRRVVEFMTHVPNRLFAHRGEDRLILRESMRGRLPEPVRRRPDKSYVAGLYHRGFRERERKKLSSLLEDPMIGQLPYVEVAGLRRHLEEYWEGRFDDHSYFQRPLALEIWLRSSYAQSVKISSLGEKVECLTK